MEENWEFFIVRRRQIAEVFPAVGPQHKKNHKSLTSIYPFDSFIHDNLVRKPRTLFLVGKTYQLRILTCELC